MKIEKKYASAILRYDTMMVQGRSISLNKFCIKEKIDRKFGKAVIALGIFTKSYMSNSKSDFKYASKNNDYDKDAIDVLKWIRNDRKKEPTFSKDKRKYKKKEMPSIQGENESNEHFDKRWKNALKDRNPIISSYTTDAIADVYKKESTVDWDKVKIIEVDKPPVIVERIVYQNNVLEMITLFLASFILGGIVFNYFGLI